MRVDLNTCWEILLEHRWVFADEVNGSIGDAKLGSLVGDDG